MDDESRIKPIICHLAWLADRIEAPVNDGRLKDATLLVYNAAVMLQWRFVLPVSWSDVIQNVGERRKAAGVIDRLVTSAEKIVAKADGADWADQGRDKPLRTRLVANTTRAVQKLQGLLRIGEVVPARMPALEDAINIRKILDELLVANAEHYAATIEEGRLAAANGEVGADVAFKEAIAELIYIHDDAREAMSTGLRRSLTQMAAGFFKTTVELQAEEHFSQAWRKRLLWLADSLVVRATSAYP